MPDETPIPDSEPSLKHGPLPVVTPAGERAGMLPGIAGVSIFVLFLAMMGAFGAVTGQFMGTGSRYVVLSICTFMLIGVVGLLRLRRWGWSLVIAGCLLASLGYIYKSRVEHDPRFLVMAGFAMVFFLYLSRTEVRERLR